MSYRVLLPTTEPNEPGLLDYMRCHSVERQIELSTANTGFEEYWYSHPDREMLVRMIAEFWGEDDGFAIWWDRPAQDSNRICRVCDGLRSSATGGCTNGLCATCHRRFCSAGGITSPGHDVNLRAARAKIAKEKEARP